MRAAAGGRIPVAQIIGNSALGGVAACILNYYSHMDRERYRFDFFTYGPSPFDEKLHSIDPEAKVFYIPSLDKTFYKAVPALKKLLAEGGYRAGGISIRDVYVAERDLALARLALMRMEGESRSSAGAVEALVNLKFCELLKQCDEEAYKSGGIDLKAYTQSKIALAEAELKMLEYENLLKRNETFAKLAGEFSVGKCPPEILKALVDAESIRPERRGGPGAPDGMPRPDGAPQPPGGHHRPDAVPVPGK